MKVALLVLLALTLSGCIVVRYKDGSYQRGEPETMKEDCTKEDQPFEFMNLGDAVVETKQISPIPPFYADSTFGLGKRPNGD